MAYMSQDKKKQLAAGVKMILQGTGIKYTLSVHNHSTIELNIKSGPIDFLGNAYEVAMSKPRPDHLPYVPQKSLQVNPYWYQEHFSGPALDILKQVIPALNVGNHNRSDILSDYHDVGWYVHVNIGRWNQPYQVVK